MDWFKLTSLESDIRPNINSEKKNITPKSPSIQAAKFVACQVGVFYSTKHDSICSSTILDVKGWRPAAPPLVFQLLSRWRPRQIYFWAFFKKTPALQSKKFVKIIFDDQDDHDNDDADDDTA